MATINKVKLPNSEIIYDVKDTVSGYQTSSQVNTLISNAQISIDKLVAGTVNQTIPKTLLPDDIGGGSNDFSSLDGVITGEDDLLGAQDRTITSLTQTDGIVSAHFDQIQIEPEQVTGLGDVAVRTVANTISVTGEFTDSEANKIPTVQAVYNLIHSAGSTDDESTDPSTIVTGGLIYSGTTLPPIADYKVGDVFVLY